MCFSFFHPIQRHKVLSKQSSFIFNPPQLLKRGEMTILKQNGKSFYLADPFPGLFARWFCFIVHFSLLFTVQQHGALEFYTSRMCEQSFHNRCPDGVCAIVSFPHASLVNAKTNKKNNIIFHPRSSPLARQRRKFVTKLLSLSKKNGKDLFISELR